MIRVVIVAALMLAAGRAAAQHGPPPPLVFDPPSIDLGVLGDGEAGTGTTMIRNAGDKPVKILRTIASCSCTYAKDISGTTLQPGEVVELTGSMTPKPGLGKKQEKISIIAEGYGQYAVVYINAEVALPIRATPSSIDAYQVGNEGEISLVARDGRPFTIIRANGRRPSFVGFDPESDEPRSEYTLAWDVNGYTRDTIPWYWVVETDHPDALLVDLRVRHDWTRPSRVKPRWNRGDARILAGVLHVGDTHSFTTKLKYHPDGHPDPGVPRIKAVTPGIAVRKVSAEPKANDLYVTVDVEVLEQGAGLLYEELEVTHGGFSSPVMFFAQLVEGGKASAGTGSSAGTTPEKINLAMIVIAALVALLGVGLLGRQLLRNKGATP